jgi:hypothetical protein
MTIDEIRDIIAANNAARRQSYEGLTSAEIGAYNRVLMFGENDEAFPDADEWSRIVD